MTTGAELAVHRVVFLLLKQGDFRKLRGKANDAPGGGGARDLRFSPVDKFWPIFKKMFPYRKTSKGGREILYGPAEWRTNGKRRAELEVWAPTEARPNECRLAKVHSYGFAGLATRDSTSGEGVLMLFQLSNGAVIVHFTTETSLRSDAWHATIRDIAVKWFGGSRGSAAFRDFETQQEFN